ncbi:UNVERIFIED_CONTAM: hypothetical protein GTU68_009181 [Idotea baltica]|nr:hypothetical protein [Idotea baltica]
MKKIFNFDFSNFKGDIFGGITAGIVALPLALAFGLQSGLGAAAGLYGAIFISFFAAWLGGTNTQISGPTAPMTAVSMVAVAAIIAGNEGNLERAIPVILMVFLLAGLFQVVLGFLKVGSYIRYIPYPVVSGFMTGIGVIILITQILPMIGYYPKEDSVIGSLRVLGTALKNINYVDLILGLITIFIIYGFKRITTAVPSTLVALLVVSLGAFFLLPGYRTIGDIPSGFPSIHLDIFGAFSLSAIVPYIVTALSLAVLGAIDSLLTSVVADNMTKTKHDPNRELVGQGIGNSISALFGGLPGAGATIRTVVNINSGGKTRISGMMAGILLLVVLLSMGPMASKIPAAVLAGILVTVGIGVMDYKGLKHVGQLPRSEVVIMFLVLILTVFVGLIEAVAIGLILASILFMKKISDVVDNRTKSAPLRAFSKELPWEDEGMIMGELQEKVYIKHLDGPLFFGFASRFQDMVQAMPQVKFVVMRMDKVPYVDQSGLYAMDDAIEDLQRQDITVLFTDLNGQPLDIFEKFNIIPGLVSRDHVFETFADCAAWMRGHLLSKELELQLQKES